MVQLTTCLRFVLVTVEFFHPHATAAPVNTVAPKTNLKSRSTPSSIPPAVDVTLPNVVPVEFAPQLEASITVSRTILNAGAQVTATRWKMSSTTVKVMATTTVSDGGAGLQPQVWVLPEEFADLSPFNVRNMPYGSSNLAVVKGIPVTASATGVPNSSPTTPATATPATSAAVALVFTSPELPRPWTNSSSAYRLFFPSGSRNPRNKPQGGSEFYASPLSVQPADNITFEYSVFFPADFEWVKGGKLPGLYGGHGECSGGDSASSCFSTRLMWREEGAGELYLYAPKNKQTPELCQTPPQSVCNANYGLSVGRGSFYFTAGDWTHVSQTVRLNTPGKQDGGFELVVNGLRVMRRDDVLYRDSQQNGGDGNEDGGGDNRDHGNHGGKDDTGDDGSEDGQGAGGHGNENDGDDSGNTGDGSDGLDLGGLLGDLLGRDTQLDDDADNGTLPPQLTLPGMADMFESGGLEQVPLSSSEMGPNFPDKVVAEENDADPLTVAAMGASVTATSTQSAVAYTTTISDDSHTQIEAQNDAQGAIGFLGIFFSTFFGGHELSWASPKDQYIYFKDFGLAINS